MKKLLFFFLFGQAVFVAAQTANTLLVTTSDNFASIPPNTNMVLVHDRAGYTGTIWKLIPNDRFSPGSTDVRVVGGSRYRKLSIGTDSRLTLSTLPATEAPYIPLWQAGNALGKSVLFQRGTSVGINTLTPQANLHVSGDFQTDTAQITGIMKAKGETFLGTSGAPVAIGTGINYGLHGLTIGTSNFNELSINAFVNPGLKIARNGTDGSGLQLEGHVIGKSVVLENLLGIANLRSSEDMNLYSVDSNIYLAGKTGVRINSTNGAVDLRTGASPGTTRLYIPNSGGVGIGTNSPTAPLDVAGDRIRIRNNITPPTSTSDTSGEIGDMAFDDNYGYRKTTAGWKRFPLSTF